MEFGRPSNPFPLHWQPNRRMSFVTALIIANVVVSLLQWGADWFFPRFTETYFALSREGIAEGFYWQFLTYMFLHGSVLHLLVNCLGLYFAGREVEIVCGPKHLLGIYFLGGLIGGILQLSLETRDIPVIGASAGVCAVLLAFTTMLPELEITALIYFVIPVRMRAKWLGRAIVISSILFAVTPFGGNIGHLAHLGGAITGWFYTRQLGFGGEFWFQQFLRDRRSLRNRQEHMDPNEFINREIDPILDKIAREGIHSLTRAERKILEMGREKIAKKTSPPGSL